MVFRKNLVFEIGPTRSRRPLGCGEHRWKAEDFCNTVMFILCVTMFFDRCDCKKAAPQNHVTRAHEKFRNRV